MNEEKLIKTYNTQSFRERYIQQKQVVDELMKPGFDKFFIVKVEEMSRLMNLPVPPSRTDTNTIIYLTAGTGTMRIGSEKFKIAARECLVVPAGQVFSFEKVERNRGYLCNFHTDILIGKYSKDVTNDFNFLQVWGHPRMRFDKQHAVFVHRLFDRLLIDYKDHALTNMTIIQTYLLALLSELKLVYASFSKQNQAIFIANEFRQLLFKHLKVKHQVSEYAELLHISPNHLNKAVKGATGKSPGQWIDEVIVLEAKVLLYQSTLSIGEVAEEVGIFDQSYFSRLFKKYQGITPLSFRKRIDKS